MWGRAERTRRPVRCAVVLTLPLAVMLATAAPRFARAEPPPGKRALLTLIINHVNKGEALVYVVPGDVFVGVETLERHGVRGFAGRRELIDTRAFVSLGSLAPALTYGLDEKALTVSLTVQPELLGTSALNLRPSAPPGIEYTRATSAFLNYGLNWVERTGADVSAEAGVHVGPAVAMTTLSWTRDRSFLRGQTSVVIDNRAQLRRWTVGDTFVRAGLLGGGLMLGGLRVSREYALDPYFVQFPGLGVSGAVITPSTAEVYVNDQLVSRQYLEPGRFQLNNLPVVSGTNLTRVVIRDAFGREQEIVAPYYLATSTLARGLQEYDYSVGFPRLSLLTKNFSYGRLTFAGQHRYGISDAVTLGYRLEADGSLVSGGPTLSLGLPIGQLDASLAASRDERSTGAAAALGYGFTGRTWVFGFAGRAADGQYATLASVDRARQPSVEVHGFVAARIGPNTSLRLQHTHAGGPGILESDRTSVFGMARLTGRVQLMFGGTRARTGAGVGYSAELGLGVYVGNRTNANVNVAAREGDVQGYASLQRSLPMGIGYGYRTQIASGPTALGTAAFQYQGRYGRYEVGSDVSAGGSTARVSIAGSLVAVGRNLFASRPLGESFAVAGVADVSGVRVFANNHEIGRTNGRGQVLIPTLLPYYGNRLSIVDQDVPVDYVIEETHRTVAPPYRGGALVSFRARRMQSVRGAVVLDLGGKSLVPEFGELQVTAAGRSFHSPIGRNGDFYFEDVPSGTHPAVVRFDNLECPFTLTIPGETRVAKLGTLRCAVPEAR